VAKRESKEAKKKAKEERSSIKNNKMTAFLSNLQIK